MEVVATPDRARAAWAGGAAVRALGLHVALPLTAGVAVYAAARSGLASVGQADGTTQRAALDFIRFNLPDGLWTYALTTVVAVVWTNGADVPRRAWLLAALGLGLALEFGQGARVVPGTFDPLDVFSILAAWVAALMSSRGRWTSS